MDTFAVLLLAIAAFGPRDGDAKPRVAPLAVGEGGAASRAVIERFAGLGTRNAVATYALPGARNYGVLTTTWPTFGFRASCDKRRCAFQLLAGRGQPRQPMRSSALMGG